MLDFAFDTLCAVNKGYPNLSTHRPRPYTPEWRQFDQHWPCVVPLRLLTYLDDMSIPYRVWSTADAPAKSLYPIAFSWFDFSIDYVSLIPVASLEMIRRRHLRVLFYYHEGDDPARIRERLDYLCWLNEIDPNQTLLISANTSAMRLDRCGYFDDFETWFWDLNREQTPHVDPDHPTKDFTVLSRTNKSWRACIMYDLYSQSLLDNSLWSYASDQPMIDDPRDNPLEYGDHWPLVQKFLQHGPYTCDAFDTGAQNDHHLVNEYLYTGARLHIVLETHLDADGSGGCFITEKTYKCIKFGQPFVIAGTAGTLELLRSHGYRVFDHVIDNSYDRETDNTRRWYMLLREIKHLRSRLDHAWQACREDCQHNARLFSSRPRTAVNNLMQEITCRG